MPYIIIALIIGLIGAIAFFYNPIIKLISEKKARPFIDNEIFSEGEFTRQEVLKSIHQITNHKYYDENVLDYFYKIKGNQIINMKKPVDFWVRTYLSSPTKIKLSYFEQIDFYKLFLNEYSAFNDSFNCVDANKDKEMKEEGLLVS
ncbi:hypothetical protein [Saccharicrinis aurantiacus]|uniref:hypothetical protein n=1 Tax=Saccharicrinis aurantiacus TaxID=1849719 RepID=UPI000838D23F|nr:hypothetical protein [Saccharicrinis aurantiacus]